MSISYEFATERAEEAALAAETAELDNVRDRALRSEAAWRDMAVRARKTEESRAKREATAEAARVTAAEAAAEAEAA
ncbi:hypothetical protein ABVV53_07090 [Novosphingobium sp. RD2P27]|uniref:Uncharacterized protein n=1 Tax=Novosphingobium kalidii TaxID=3230299 RepID=A0ABV2D041_9SPHN